MHPYDTIPDDRKLVIYINDNGTVGVSGPIGNKFICWAMLEEARQAIAAFKPSAIVQPSQQDVSRLNGHESKPN